MNETFVNLTFGDKPAYDISLFFAKDTENIK